MLALCLALALLATDGDGLRFEGSVAAGGGYDSNLLIAPGSDAAGSTIASVSASGGAAIDLSESAFLYVGATIDGAKFPTLPELDRTSVEDRQACSSTSSAPWRSSSERQEASGGTRIQRAAAQLLRHAPPYGTGP